MRILVLGGSGFIGARLTDVLLEYGHDLTVLDKHAPERAGVRYIAGDVCNADTIDAAVKGIDTVFHLAALHTDDVRDTSQYYKVNVDGTRNVVAACIRAEVRRIIFTSTVACYGLDANHPDEQAPLAPFNDYARSKLQAEDILRQWASAAGNQAIIVRPSVVFGERNRGNVYNLLRQIHRGRFPMVGEGKNRKSMAYVGNVAEFLAWCLVNVRGTELFNYADKPDLSTRELVDTARAVMGLSGRPLRIPYALALSLGHACDIVSALTRSTLPFSKIRVIKFCADTTVDASKAHASGFKPRYSIEHALRQTIQNEFGGAQTDR